MAENVSGSYAFTMVDTDNTLWLVKGESPLTVLHFPKLQMYVYASTSPILMEAVVSCEELCKAIVAKDFVQISVQCGDIVRVTADGKLLRDTFDFNYGYYGRYDWRSYSAGGWYNSTPAPVESKKTVSWEDNLYYQQIKQLGRKIGYTDKDIDDMLAEGFSLDEIADWLYDEETEINGTVVFAT
jgi:hypothetical protein